MNNPYFEMSLLQYLYSHYKLEGFEEVLHSKRIKPILNYTDSHVIPTSLHSRENTLAASRKVGITFLFIFGNFSAGREKSV